MSMKLHGGRGLVTVFPLSALLVLGLGCGPTASAPQTSSNKTVDTVPVDTVVVLTVSPTNVSADIVVALIKTGGSITWSVQGLPAGQTLEIDFQAQGAHKGPFQASPEALRLRAKEKATVSALADRYTITGGGTLAPVESFPAGYPGAWKYAVTLRDTSSGAVVAAIDPMIVVK